MARPWTIYERVSAALTKARARVPNLKSLKNLFFALV